MAEPTPVNPSAEAAPSADPAVVQDGAAPSADAAPPAAEPVAAEPVAQAEPAPAEPTTPDKSGEPEAAKAEPAPDPQKDDAAQSDQSSPLPTFEPFTLPEGFQPDETLNQFTSDLAEFTRDNGLDPAVAQKFGQDLVDKYVAKNQEVIQRIAEHQTTVWEETKSAWKDALEKDPEIGGNRLETTTQSLRQAVEKYAGTEDQVKEFREINNTMGWGNHPALVRLINNLVTKINVYETESASPLSAQATAPKTKSMTERRYGSMRA